MIVLIISISSLVLLIYKPYLLTIILQSTKRFVSEKHVGLQLFVMEKISKYNYKFHDMKAKFDWYTILSLEKISGPVKPQKNLIAIELIAKCFSNKNRSSVDLVREIFSLLWTFRTGYTLSYFDMKRIVQSSNNIKRCGFESLSKGYAASLAFLLLDDPKIAYLYCKEIESQKLPPSMTIVFWLLLQNGRRQMIRNWDVKALTALQVITSLLIEKQRVSEEIDLEAILSKKNTLVLDIKIVSEFYRTCTAIEGQESTILCNLRLELYKHIYCVTTRLEISQMQEYKEAIISQFYGNNEEIQDLKNSTLMALILKLLSDGLINHKQGLTSFSRLAFVPVCNDRELRLNPQYIRHQTDPDCSKFISSNISPHINMLGGRRLQRGECLIINQTFHNQPNQYRAGTEKDEEILIKAWNDLGCQNRITVRRDLTRSQMLSELKAFHEKLKTSQPEFMVIVILTHGSLNKKNHTDYLIDVQQKKISMSKIKKMFVDGRQCPIMIGKAKLFFVQACRADKEMTMVDTDLSETDGEKGDETIEQNGILHVNKSWFFVFQSTIKGNYSFRQPEKGSIFIQKLCQELLENGRKLDMATLASSVNQKIMKEYKIQAPVYENQLGDFIYFDPC